MIETVWESIASSVTESLSVEVNGEVVHVIFHESTAIVNGNVVAVSEEEAIVVIEEKVTVIFENDKVIANGEVESEVETSAAAYKGKVASLVSFQ